MILHFEGLNGPDAIKRKSPAKDEPWHYYSPFDQSDTKLTRIVDDHYQQLVAALKAGDKVRAAFEAAWLAHAVVDGLTPAHHFPYEEKLAELRGGKGLESRNSLKGKLIMPGPTGLSKLKNNWKMWGPKGLLNMHGTFEWGVAVMAAPLRGKHIMPGVAELAELRDHGPLELFRRKAREIHAYNVYDHYADHGWTPSLARTVRRHILPKIVQTVTLTWFATAVDAGVARDVTDRRFG